MKVAFIGGHLSPALALLEQIPVDWRVCFIGRKHSFEGDKGETLEYKVITEKNIPFISLIAGRLQRKVTRHSVISAIKIPFGYTQALTILFQQKPDIVVGFGGYLSLPVCLAANTLGIPVIIHEQTMKAGIANKIIGKFAKNICISWESSIPFFPKSKTIVTGNLVRREIIEAAERKKENGRKKTIYITGGSAGSHFINTLVADSISELLNNYTVIHQTGDARVFGDYEKLESMRDKLSEEKRTKYFIRKFVNPSEVVDLYNSSDLVISRAGLNTVTELLLLQKPSLLIPLQHGQTNEQLTNATYLEKLGLSQILLQRNANKGTFLSSIFAMMEHLDEYKVNKSMNISIYTHATDKMIQCINTAYEKKYSKKPKN